MGSQRIRNDLAAEQQHVSQICSLFIISTSTSGPSHYLWPELLQKLPFQFIFHLAVRNASIRGKVDHVIAHSFLSSTYFWLYPPSTLYYFHLQTSNIIYLLIVFANTYLQISKQWPIVDWQYIFAKWLLNALTMKTKALYMVKKFLHCLTCFPLHSHITHAYSSFFLL